MIKLNKTFSTIKEHMLPNTLIVLDFDETIMQFNNFDNIFDFWSDNFNKFYEESNDYDDADNKAYNLWLSLTQHNNDYSCTDYDGLNNLLHEITKSNNKIVIVTARDKNMDEFTRAQLDKLKINIPDIYYSSNKSDVIMDICDGDATIRNIVFVDDLYTNLDDVKENCNKYNLYLYHADFIINKHQ
jgi:hypothetical protein